MVVTAEWLMEIIMSLPRYRTLNLIKKCYLSALFGAKIGKRTIFYRGVWIFTGRNVVIGDDVDIAKGVIITTDGGVEIGDRTLIGYRTVILSSNHVIPEVGRIFDAGHDKKKVTIGSDVWIGANCTILPGVTIGSGAVVAAGSVVTKDLIANTIYAGVPAKPIRTRN